MISGKIGNGDNTWCDGFAGNRPDGRRRNAEDGGANGTGRELGTPRMWAFNLEKGLSGFHLVVVGGVKLQAAGPTRQARAVGAFGRSLLAPGRA